MNQFIQTKLRPFINHFQNDWSTYLPCLDFAHATQPHDSTGLSPAEVDLGYLPRMTFDWRARTRSPATPRDRLSSDQAQTFAKRRAEAVAYCREHLFRKRRVYEKQANRLRRPIDWTIGDKVYVRRGNWITDRPHDGLENPYLGPYPVLSSPFPNVYEIDLPPSMKIRRFINASRLIKARNDPVPGQLIRPPEPVVVNGDQEYTVTKIISSRLYYSRLQYKADWLGHDPDPTWYYAADFKNAPIRVKEFHQAFPKAPGPPKRLAKWIAAAADNTLLDDQSDDNKPKGTTKSGLKRRRKAR